MSIIDNIKRYNRNRALRRNVALEKKARSVELKAVQEKSELSRLKRIQKANSARAELARFKSQQRAEKIKRISHAFGLDKKPRKKKKSKSGLGGGFLDI